MPGSLPLPLRRLSAAAAWSIVRAGAARRGVDAGALGRVRDLIFTGAGAAPRHPDDPLQNSPMYMPGLTATPWHDPEAFPQLAGLRAAAGAIRDEATRALTEQRYRPRKPDRVITGSWRACFLRYLDGRIGENCRVASCYDSSCIRGLEEVPSRLIVVSLLRGRSERCRANMFVSIHNSTARPRAINVFGW